MYKKLIIKILKKEYIFPRLATYSKIYYKNIEIDEGIIIHYTSPNSYNGEKILEIQIHNNKYIIEKLINYIIKKFKNYKIRKAKAGEFTKRAFENKKLNFFDLEKINNVICFKNNKIKEYFNKKTKLKKIYDSVYNLRIYIENLLNFNFKRTIKINKKIKKVISIIENQFKKIYLENKKKTIKKGKKIISIIGNCNTGKSTLFNKIIGKKVTITSNIKGTTRDIICKLITIKKNRKMLLYDTTGIRETKNKIEIIGILKTIKIIKKSDLLIIIENIKDKSKIYKLIKKKFKNNKKIIYIKNKIDKIKTKTLKNKKYKFYISTKIFSNIKKIREEINKILKINKYNKNIKNRNYKLYKYLKKRIKKFIYITKYIKKNINKNIYIDICCIQLKKIQKKMEEIINLKKKRIYNTIFKNFCIGK